MLLNSRYMNYIFNFPKMFFSPEIERRYKPFLTRQVIEYKSLVDYMNYTIQSVSWPSLNVETVSQVQKNVIKTFRSGFDMQRQMSKELEVTFATKDSYLNYSVMRDYFEEYWALYNSGSEVFIPNLTLQLLDHYGYTTMSLHYQDVVFSGLSELELSAASNVPEFRTFTANFVCTQIVTKRYYA